MKETSAYICEFYYFIRIYVIFGYFASLHVVYLHQVSTHHHKCFVRLYVCE